MASSEPKHIQLVAFKAARFLSSDDDVLPVFIVGAGPVDLVLSILLAKLGKKMEVFQKLDGLAEEIERSQPPVDLWRKFIYSRSLTESSIQLLGQWTKCNIKGC
ncbi:hypothetical protein Ddye_031510 [Dipteronia dyeriana]|uniref:Uncharacterized protein n=1 Tax=Dipteronia dyeriana TaxID=168575 RepID=A0AAD9TJ04_9ROSI|nr:hypothetical protein Ddye_031510 [Dipteronia dyeriana]